MENNPGSPIPDTQSKVATPDQAPLQPTPMHMRDSFSATPVQRPPKSVYPASPVSSAAYNTAPKRPSIALSFTKIGLFIAVVVILVVVSPAIYKMIAGGLTDRTLTNEGYTYTFKFYKKADALTLQDPADVSKNVPALSYRRDVIVLAMPLRDDPLTDCAGLGDGSKQTFTITLQGEERPVCNTITPAGADIYEMTFSASGETHLFVVGFNTKINSSAAMSHDTKSLQQMFSSVTASQ